MGVGTQQGRRWDKSLPGIAYPARPQTAYVKCSPFQEVVQTKIDRQRIWTSPVSTALTVNSYEISNFVRSL
jgi:hypothetical protein